MVGLPVEPFADRYTQLRLVGRGGFGTVYRAWDPVLDRDVALKLLNADFAADSEWRKRFRKEAIAASKFHHPNITIVFDQGDYRDQPFIVMEFVEGEPLSKVIERRVPLSDSERVFLLEQLCDGLHYAHQRNIIHRDIKPVNLIVREEHHANRLVRTLKILDFGIAKIVDSAQTATGAMAFSPGYVSPEQIRGEGVDRRSDMFAVGAVAYELLVLKKAFDITSTDHFRMLNEMKRKMVDEYHQPMTAVRPDVDPDLAAVVDRALAKDPDDRFSDLEEMRRSLQHVRERLEANQKGPSQTTVVLDQKQQAAVKLARKALEADDPTAAIAHLEEGLRAGSDGAGRRLLEQSLAEAREKQAAKDAARRARDEAAALERAQADERREQDRREHERQEAERATQAIQSSREKFQAGECEAAIKLLERFEPAERVAAALSSMRNVESVLREASVVVHDGPPDLRMRALETLESVADRALVEDALARLRRVHEKRLVNESAAAAVSAAEAEFDAGQRRAALERLERYRPPHSLVEAARRRLRERNAAMNAEDDRARADEVVKHARVMFTQGDHAEAIAIVAAFEPADLVADVLDDLRRATDTIDVESSDAFRETASAHVPTEMEPGDTLASTDDSPTRSEDMTAPVKSMDWRRLHEEVTALDTPDLQASQQTVAEAGAATHDEPLTVDLQLDAGGDSEQQTAPVTSRSSPEELAQPLEGKETIEVEEPPRGEEVLEATFQPQHRGATKRRRIWLGATVGLILISGLSYLVYLQVQRARLRAQFDRWQQECASGDGFSCQSISYAYYVGRDVPKDEGRAVEFDRRARELKSRACDERYSLACWSLGSSYKHGSPWLQADKQEAIVFYRRACDAGDKDSCKDADALAAEVTNESSLRIDAQKVDSLEVVSSGQAIKFAKVNGTWQLTTPAEPRTDAAAIDSLVTRVAGAQMKSLAPGGDLKEYGLDKPSVTARFGIGSSQATLFIGKTAAEGSVYAMDASREAVFTIGSAIVDELKKDALQYRQKNLFDGRAFNTSRVELTKDREKFVFEKKMEKDKNGKDVDKWRQVAPAQKDADADKIASLLSTVTGARATSFVAKAGGTTPEPEAARNRITVYGNALEITAVLTADGKTERVTFSRAGSDAFAIRVGVPGTAKIDMRLLDDIVKAVEALR